MGVESSHSRVLTSSRSLRVGWTGQGVILVLIVPVVRDSPHSLGYVSLKLMAVLRTGQSLEDSPIIRLENFVLFLLRMKGKMGCDLLSPHLAE